MLPQCNHLCFLATSNYSSRCSPNVVIRMATPFNTFCGSSRLCSNSATTLCCSWNSATATATPASLAVGADLPTRPVGSAQQLQRRRRVRLPSPWLGRRKQVTMAARSSDHDRMLDMQEEGRLRQRLQQRCVATSSSSTTGKGRRTVAPSTERLCPHRRSPAVKFELFDLLMGGDWEGAACGRWWRGG
jgi:hypothetical protein